VFHSVKTLWKCSQVPVAASQPTPAAPAASPPTSTPMKSAHARRRYRGPAAVSQRINSAAHTATATGKTWGLIHTAAPQTTPSAAPVRKTRPAVISPARAAAWRLSR
jgi:hypothetical protein